MPMEGGIYIASGIRRLGSGVPGRLESAPENEHGQVSLSAPWGQGHGSLYYSFRVGRIQLLTAKPKGLRNL